MTTYATIRDALVTQITAVSNAGNVYAYERLVADWSNFQALFTATIGGQKQVRGWWVTRERIEAVPDAMGTTARTYVFVVRGVLGVHDSTATEETFQDLVDAVMAAIDAHRDDGDSAVRDYSVGPTLARVIEARQFGSVLCHYAELEVRVEVIAAVSYSA